ncbi:MAG: response regulator [Pseudomonadota bacterium]|nr:response regulator [Pseudomonadota bacterium]
MSSHGEPDSAFFYVLNERIRLLFADDDPILREFAKVHLATEKAEVATAADGEEAWEMVRTQPLDLLLVDLEMPKLDGFELVRRMREQPRFNNLPVIVVTGREDVSAIDRAFICGATSFVTKPINWRLLSYQVRFTLRAGRAERRLDAARADAGAKGARASETVRRVYHESEQLLALAMRGEPALQAAARRFATILTRLAAAPGRERAA